MIKTIGIGLFAFATWSIPYFTESWSLFVLMASTLCLFLLIEWADTKKHFERVLVEFYIASSLLMSIKCVLGNPFEIDAMAYVGLAFLLCIGGYHFYKYSKTLKR